MVQFRQRVRHRALACGIQPEQFGDWVDEVVGEGIGVALSHLDKWDESRGDFLVWAQLKTRTLIRDELRKERKHYERRTTLTSETEGGLPSSNRPDIAHTILMREELLEIFHSLSDSQARALALYYLMGYSVKEIASITGKPGATVYTLLRRGRQRINPRT